MLLDIVRNFLILVAAGYTVFLIWKWNWIVALLADIPIYVIMLNLIGFLTLPLYRLTPENRLKSKAYKAFQRGEVEQGKELTDEFIEKFNVNVPEETSTRE